MLSFNLVKTSDILIPDIQHLPFLRSTAIPPSSHLMSLSLGGEKNLVNEMRFVLVWPPSLGRPRGRCYIVGANRCSRLHNLPSTHPTSGALVRSNVRHSALGQKVPYFTDP